METSAASPADRGRGGSFVPITLVLALAALLRLLGLDRRSLDLDEAATWWNATRPTWLASAFAEPNHAPLWWLVTRAFIHSFGDREIILRAPAVLCGIASVWMTWYLARRLLDPASTPARAGFRGVDAGAPLLVALLVAIHPLWIEYSQDARMYSALLAESLGLSLLYLRWLESRRSSALIAYALLGAVALYTHHFALLTLAAHAAFALGHGVLRRGEGSRAPARPLLAAQLAAVVLFLPWALRSLGSGVAVATFGNFGRFQRLAFALWRLQFGPSLAALDRPRIDAGPIALFRDERLVLIAGVVVGGLALGFAWRAFRRDPVARGFVAASLIVPAGVLLLIFTRLPLLHEKYLIMMAPFVAMVAVVGARAAPRLLRIPLLVGLFGLELLGLLAYLAPRNPVAARMAVHGHPYGKEDWRGARSWVAERAAAGDLVLLYPSYLEMPWNYYDRGRLAAWPLESPMSSPEERARVSSRWSGAARVFLVTAGIKPAVRESLVWELSRLKSPTAPSELIASSLFPLQWGVWAYEFRGGSAEPRSGGSRP